MRLLTSSPTNLDLQNVRAVAAAIAVRAANEDVAEELHLDFLEAGTATFLTLADGGVEAERAGVEAALLGDFGLCEDFADVVERADIDGGIGARRFAESGLIHHDHAAEGLEAGEVGGQRSEVGGRRSVG